MPLPILGAIGAVKTGLGIASAVGSLIGGAKRQKKADQLSGEAVKLARQDYNDRAPARAGAMQHLSGPLGVNPAAGVGPSARYSGAAGQTDAAAGRVAGYGGLGTFRGVQPGQEQDYSGAENLYNRAGGQYDAARLGPVGMEAGRARTLAAGQLEGVAGAPSRQSIARDRFQNLLDETDDQRTLGVRSIGQNAARLGRLGSGMVTTDLGNLEDRLQTNLFREARGLSADTAAMEEQDRIGRLDASLRAGGQFRGEDFREGSYDADLAMRRGDSYRGLGRDVTDLGGIRFGQQARLRDEGRLERDAETDFRLRGLDADRSVLDSMQRREGQVYDQDVNERDFLDRTYQSGLDNRLRFGSALGGIGFRGPDTGTLMQGAQQQAGASEGMIGRAAGLFGELARSGGDTAQNAPVAGAPPPAVRPRLAPVGVRARPVRSLARYA